jgi:Ca-activated chloride channel family protein
VEVFGMTIENYLYIWPGIGFFVLLLVCYGKRLSSRRRFFDALSHKKHRKILFRGYSGLRSVVAGGMFFSGLLALFFCFLRIGWGDQRLNVQQRGRAVLFALDISRSMLAADVSPTRLELAKIKIRSMLQDLGPERVGLLLFSQTAILQCPFTSDFKTFLSFLDQLDSSVVCSTAQTSLTEAFLKAIDAFNRSKVASKILVMITDGEDFSKGTVDVLDRAKREGVALLALGVGTKEGAPVPIIDTFGKVVGHERDDKGAVILTKLDEEKLIATVTHLGGTYHRLTYSDEDLGSIKMFVHQFEKEHFDDASFVVRNETYPFFALLASGLLFLEALIL